MAVRIILAPLRSQYWIAAVARTEALEKIKGGQFERVPVAARPWIKKGWNFAMGQWEETQRSAEGTWRNWVYRNALRLMSRLPSSEHFLMSIPPKASSITSSFDVLYPSRHLTRAAVVGRLTELAGETTELHRTRMWRWIYVFPFIMPVGFLPLPNLPLYWNLYRIYCNWKAVAGGDQLKMIMNEGEGVRESGDKLSVAESPEKERQGVGIEEEGVVAGGGKPLGGEVCVHANCCLKAPVIEMKGLRLLACHWLDDIVHPETGGEKEWIGSDSVKAMQRKFELGSITEQLVRLRHEMSLAEKEKNE